MKCTLQTIMVIMTISILSCNPKKQEQTFTVPFEKYTLDNGLTVILNEDKSDPITALTIYYHVGSSREVPGKTGFAHLFEHMMFQRSENVGEDQLFKIIQGAGGTLNGGTNQDMTVYYEVVPKNALETALWLESDRMGFLSNTVTKAALVNQQNVVQNEKRQNYDNTVYGFNRGLIAKALYPAEHPYSWITIGEMEDLTNATVEDVKTFHKQYYTPNNATLVISGDIDTEQVKTMIEKYFGEIPAGEQIEKRDPMNVSLASTVKLYHEDNLATVPQFTMVFPTVEQYSKDSYALACLGELLAGGKKTPLYVVLVKDKKLTSRVSARNGSQELTGSFTISVTANPGVSLAEVEKAIFEAFDKFENEGFSEEDLLRIKAGNETSFYQNFTSVENKAFALGEYQMNTGDPAFYLQDFNSAQAVTMEDIKLVFEKYIKEKNYVATSFVPKGETNLIAENSVNAGIIEEDVTKAAEVRSENIVEEPIVKTPTTFDRSVQPVSGPDPDITMPTVWTGSLSNGMRLSGIVQNELPLVQYQIVIEGGHILDNPEKAGMAYMVAALMNEGTKNKTPEELEDAIGLLGASISIGAGTETITINVSSVARNFEKTLALVEEMLLEPRWDEEQFGIVKSRIINGIISNKASPVFQANTTLKKLLFGDSSILAIENTGTEESVAAITMDDLKSFYANNFSPSVSAFLLVGDINKEMVETALSSLNEKWVPKDVVLPKYNQPEVPEKSAVYFVDIPGAKQSVINIGSPALQRNDPDYYPTVVANYKLGGSFNGVFNLILREEKGFTYGARSSLTPYRNTGYFSALSTVRTNATLESVTIFKTEMEKYRTSVPQEYVDFTKDNLIKGNALRFETLGSLLDMISTMNFYKLPSDYIKQEEAYVKGLTTEKIIEYSQKYIDPARMYYVVVGDAATQLKDLEKLGFGKPIIVKN